MSNNITRSQAKSWTLAAQLASVVFVLCAVALGIVGLPEPKTNAIIDQTNQPMMMDNSQSRANSTNPNSINDGLTSMMAIDSLGLSERLALLDNAPVMVNKEPVDTTDFDPEPEQNIDDGEIAKRVRYVGFINDPDNRHAFIRIDGKQRIVALGSTARSGNEDFPDLIVERITPDAIVLNDGERRGRVPLASRSNQSITMAGGAPVEVVESAAASTGLTEEDEARIAAMPARQQPLARRRLERERRGLPPENENRKPTPKPQREYRGGFTTRNN
ncbi:MAG: hypothetical protein P1U42_01180 [Phycisphaerales bacterium]|jgi:hypothetical protein|nr:hypothetical protein [Phycisphaerales bacterium]